MSIRVKYYYDENAQTPYRETDLYYTAYGFAVFVADNAAPTTRPGYTFRNKWSVSTASYDYGICDNNQGVIIDQWRYDTVLFVRGLWNINQYTVTFNTNGNNDTIPTSIANATATYGQTFVIPSVTRTGYTFAGWNNSTIGTKTANWTWDTDGTNGATYAFTAQWTIKQYKVTFSANGKGTDKTVMQDYNTTATFPALKAVGWQFQGWSTTSTGAVTNLADSILTFLNDVTYFAVWTENTGGKVSFSELQTVWEGSYPISISEYQASIGKTANTLTALSADFKGKGPLYYLFSDTSLFLNTTNLSTSISKGIIFEIKALKLLKITGIDIELGEAFNNDTVSIYYTPGSLLGSDRYTRNEILTNGTLWYLQGTTTMSGSANTVTQIPLSLFLNININQSICIFITSTKSFAFYDYNTSGHRTDIQNTDLQIKTGLMAASYYDNISWPTIYSGVRAFLGKITYKLGYN